MSATIVGLTSIMAVDVVAVVVDVSDAVVDVAVVSGRITDADVVAVASVVGGVAMGIVTVVPVLVAVDSEVAVTSVRGGAIGSEAVVVGVFVAVSGFDCAAVEVTSVIVAVVASTGGV